MELFTFFNSIYYFFMIFISISNVFTQHQCTHSKRCVNNWFHFNCQNEIKHIRAIFPHLQLIEEWFFYHHYCEPRDRKSSLRLKIDNIFGQRLSLCPRKTIIYISYNYWILFNLLRNGWKDNLTPIIYCVIMVDIFYIFILFFKNFS